MRNKMNRIEQIRNWFYQNEPDMDLLRKYIFEITWEAVF